ncbi:putative bifunctional diguanylate cyclase/phosphodiesterase [Alteromonas sp. CYL-A6]|uniref:putative bifunctional diguanylate cyclase/phosphodiesterase n=1 Tax=Alteromonas nitratireducens TaxID=3390813 RepID=UPI0034C2653B
MCLISLRADAGQVIIDDDFTQLNLHQLSDSVELAASDNYRDALRAVPGTHRHTLFGQQTSSGRTWLKTEIINQGTRPRSLVLTLYRHSVTDIQVFFVDNEHRIIRSATYQTLRGQSVTGWPTPYLHFSVDIPESEAITAVVGIETEGPNNFRPGLWDAQAFDAHERLMVTVFGVLTGMLLIAFVYFLLSYLLQRTPARFWLAVAFGLTSLLVFVCQGGLAFWPSLTPAASAAIATLLATIAMSLAKVAHNLFNRLPLPVRFINLIMPAVLLLFSFWTSLFDASQFIYLFTPVIGVYQVVMVLLHRDRRHPELSQAFSAGWLFLFALYAVVLIEALNGLIVTVPVMIVMTLITMLAMLCFAMSVEGKERSVSVQQLMAREKTISNLHQFYDLFRNSAEGLYTSTLEGRLKSVNPAMCSLFGYADENTMLASVSNTSDFYADASDRELLLGELLESGHVMGREIRGRRADGTEFWFSISCQLRKDSNGSFLYGSIFDITERKRTSLSLEFLATHDSLTGIYNRREFERHFAASIADPDASCTLLFLDLDRFKVVNDTCGHKAGDALIKEVATLLEQTLGNAGMLARLGGDEFGVLFVNQPEETAYLCGIKLMNAIQAYRFVWEKKIFTLGVSIGMVVCKEISDDPEQCLSMADAACYYAKEQGRNQIHRFRKDDQAMLRYKNELDWVTAINEALENNRFTLFYQPYRTLRRTSEQVYYEILLRMQDADGELLSPDRFLPVAERYNLSVKVDKWVIEHTFRWLATHPDYLEKTARVSINLSGQSLADRELKLHALNMFERHAIPYSKVCFEITESVAILKMENTVNFMRTFTQLGCTFALDDFGSGFSSYNYLKNLPVACVKIDGTFIRDMLTSTVDAAVVSSITDVASAMGMETVGEYVESEAIMTELGKIGVDYAQGYGVARPRPLSDFS